MERWDLIEFSQKIGLSLDAVDEINGVGIGKEEVLKEYQLLCENESKFFEKNGSAEHAPLRYLALYCEFALLAWDFYEKRGIPCEIYYNTFADIALWEQEFYRRTGRHGIAEVEWLSKHVRLKLFRLQELQFEPIIAPGVLPEELKTLPVLNIHIPKGAGIDLKAVDCACQEALRFWNYEKAVFFCHSWLLSPALKKLLPPETRIVQFGAKFHLLELDEECRQAEERIFGKVLDNPADYSAQTSLQKKAQKYLISGEKIPSAYGYFVLE